MQVEAAILPTQVRFEKLCKNYALRILQMQETHPVKVRVSSNSPFSSDGINLTKLNLNLSANNQLADWNQQLSYSESETEPEYYSQRKKKNRAKSIKKRKFPSQIFRLCSHLKDIIPAESNKIETFNSA